MVRRTRARRERGQSRGSEMAKLRQRGKAIAITRGCAAASGPRVDAYWRAVCAAARSEIREPNAGIGRITLFSFSAEASGRLRRDHSAIDRYDRSAGSRRAFLPTTRIASGAQPRPAARCAAPRSQRRAARQSVARRRGCRAPCKFFPCVCTCPVHSFSRCRGREGIGLSSPSLIARRYRTDPDR